MKQFSSMKNYDPPTSKLSLFCKKQNLFVMCFCLVVFGFLEGKQKQILLGLSFNPHIFVSSCAVAK